MADQEPDRDIEGHQLLQHQLDPLLRPRSMLMEPICQDVSVNQKDNYLQTSDQAELADEVHCPLHIHLLMQIVIQCPTLNFLLKGAAHQNGHMCRHHLLWHDLRIEEIPQQQVELQIDLMAHTLKVIILVKH